MYFPPYVWKNIKNYMLGKEYWRENMKASLFNIETIRCKYFVQHSTILYPKTNPYVMLIKDKYAGLLYFKKSKKNITRKEVIYKLGDIRTILNTYEN